MELLQMPSQHERAIKELQAISGQTLDLFYCHMALPHVQDLLLYIGKLDSAWSDVWILVSFRQIIACMSVLPVLQSSIPGFVHIDLLRVEVHPWMVLDEVLLHLHASRVHFLAAHDWAGMSDFVMIFLDVH
jgi:hypothetical protein